MARKTAITRWPVIVQAMVDDVEETAAASEPFRKPEAHAIAEELRRIKDDIEHNRKLKPLKPDGSGEVDSFNQQLATLGNELTWQASPWLFAECYLYRRVETIFSRSTHWKGFDVFKRQKDETFAKSKNAVEELAAHYIQGDSERSNLGSPDVNNEAQKLVFLEMTQIALWGNATDLSPLNSLTLEQLQSLQVRQAIAEHQRNIVDDDTDAVWNYLADPSRTNRRIDFVLDNAGFELFTDVIYAAYLLQSRLADCIIFHVKEFPWFVSDATPDDITSMFSHLESKRIFRDRQHIDPLVKRLRRFFDKGEMSIMSHFFWTTASSFYDMEDTAPNLFKSLRSSGLVVFKGDLNYRKLTRDGLWPHNTPFENAIGPLGPGSSMKILALRTNKADVCVGVDQPRLDALNDESPNEDWVRNGNHAVISFSDGKLNSA